MGSDRIGSDRIRCDAMRRDATRYNSWLIGTNFLRRYAYILVKLKCNAKCNRSTLANGRAGHGRAIIAAERIKLIARNGKFQLSNDSLQNARGNYALARTLVTHRNNGIVHNQFQPRARITLPRLHQSLTRLSCNRAS